MMNYQTPARSGAFTVVAIAIVIVIGFFVAGGVTALGLAETDIVNQNTSGANAEKTLFTVERDRSIHEMEMTYLQEEREAKSNLVIAETKGEQQTVEAETIFKLETIQLNSEIARDTAREALRFSTALHNLAIDALEWATKALAVVLTVAGLAIVIHFSRTLQDGARAVFTAFSTLVFSLFKREDNLKDPEFRRRLIDQLREKERLERLQLLQGQGRPVTVTSSPNGQNGHHQREATPQY